MAIDPQGRSLRVSRFSDSSRVVQLFARIDGGKRLATRRFDPLQPVGLAKWQYLPDITSTGSPGVPTMCRPNEEKVVVRRSDGAPVFSEKVNDQWRSWTALGGSITGSPEIASISDRDTIVVRGTSGRPFYKDRMLGKAWNTSASGWKQLGGSISDSLSMVAIGDLTVISTLSTTGIPLVKWRWGGIWAPGPRRWIAIGTKPCRHAPSIGIRETESHGQIMHFSIIEKDNRLTEIKRISSNTGAFLQDLELEYKSDDGRDLESRPSFADCNDGYIRSVFRRDDNTIDVLGTSFTPHNGSQGGHGFRRQIVGFAVDSPLIVPNDDPDNNSRLFVTGLSGRVFTTVIPDYSPGSEPVHTTWVTLGEETIV